MRFGKISSVTIIALLMNLSNPAFVDAKTTIVTPGANIYEGNDGVALDLPNVHIDTRGHSSSTATSTQIQTGVEENADNASSTASYNNANLAGMDFSNKNLERVSFVNSSLSGANFSGANLTSARFTNSVITNADFSNAILVSVDFSNANLSGAKLINADLSKANLTNATLDGANISNAVFAGAKMTNANLGNTINDHAVAQRSPLVSAQNIVTALKIDPLNPRQQRKIDLTVNFDFNSDKLTRDGSNQVKAIAEAINGSGLQNSKILIEGHTDDVGSVSYNKALSMRRATKVMNVLASDYGVPDERLSAQGFGKSRPIADNSSDLGRAMNRRVTLVNIGIVNQ